MRRRWWGLALLAGVLVACSEPPDSATQQDPPAQPPPAESGESSEEAQQWANEYCSAALHFVDAVSTAPDVDPSSPERAAATARELLGVIESGLDESVTELNELGSAPIAGADEVADEARQSRSELQERTEQARTELGEVGHPPDAQAASAALDTADGVLDEVAALDLLGGMAEVPGFTEASEQAAACTELTAGEAEPRMGPDGP